MNSMYTKVWSTSSCHTSPPLPSPTATSSGDVFPAHCIHHSRTHRKRPFPTHRNCFFSEEVEKILFLCVPAYSKYNPEIAAKTDRKISFELLRIASDCEKRNLS